MNEQASKGLEPHSLISFVHLRFLGERTSSGSFDFLCFRIRLGLSLYLGGLEQIQEEVWRWFRENGARSWPPSLLTVVFLFSFPFLLLGCGFDNDLIMVGLWVVTCGGCGLWAQWWC